MLKLLLPLAAATLFEFTVPGTTGAPVIMIGVVFITVVTGDVISAPRVWVSVVDTIVVAEGVANEPAGTAL